MSRPQKCRRVCAEPRYKSFAPSDSGGMGETVLTTDEYEVLRLVDYERKTHEECALQMDISRTTVTEIYDSARKKMAEFLVDGTTLRIEGGNYRICDGSAPCCCDRHCYRDFENDSISSGEAEKYGKPENALRIAVTFESGRIFPHFGQTKHFQLYDAESGTVISKTLINTFGSGRGALPEVLKRLGTDILICGGIGTGALKALEEREIKVISGVSGNTEQAVSEYLSGSLKKSGSICGQ